MTLSELTLHTVKMCRANGDDMWEDILHRTLLQAVLIEREDCAREAETRFPGSIVAKSVANNIRGRKDGR